MRPFPNQPRSGFTLLELIIVMSILALLAAAVTPVFSGALAGARAKNSAHAFADAMRQAQSAAVVEAVEHRVYFEPKDGVYWLERETVSIEGERLFEGLPGRDGETEILIDSLMMHKPKAREGQERGQYYVAFYPSGTCDVAQIDLLWDETKKPAYALETTGLRVSIEETGV